VGARRLQAAGRPLAPTPERVLGEGESLQDFTAHYLRARAPVLAGATIRNREEDYRRRIGPALGHLTLAEITRERVALWLGDLAARAPSRRMVVQTLATLRVILSAAVEWERIPTNPAAGHRIALSDAQERSGTERVLDRQQLAALIAGTCSLRVETIIRVAAEAGLRKGEVIGLRWPDVLLGERRIEVRRAVWQDRRAGAPPPRVVKSTKGGRARRVAIGGPFAERLSQWFAESVIEGGADSSGYVWPGRGGQPMNECSANRGLRRALVRAGLLDTEGKPLVTFHGLRHTAASIMLAEGVPLIVVSRQLGHANPHITATTYAHLLGDSELDLAAAVFERMPGVRGDAPVQVGEPGRRVGADDEPADGADPPRD